MRKKKKADTVKLNTEEKEILKSLERGEWKTVANINSVKEEVKNAAVDYMRRKKEQRISIRVFAKDLERLKEMAVEEGMPYQTLVTSILHKYTTGKLKSV